MNHSATPTMNHRLDLWKMDRHFVVAAVNACRGIPVEALE